MDKKYRKVNIFDDVAGEKEFLDLQYRDFCKLQDLFEEFLFSIDSTGWKYIIGQFSNVIRRCDEIDFEEYGAAIAYASCHLLDRYHRFQMIINDLLKKGCLCYVKDREYNVLDIGTGPSNTLFCLSDYFTELNELCGENFFRLDAEYVERSNGFRNFLHHFVELAYQKGIHYSVPFHHATSDDAFDIPFNLEIENRYNPNKCPRYYIRKRRYDVVVLSNFLTNTSFVKSYKEQLEKIARNLRNHGLLIVVGASSSVGEYSEVYNIIHKVIFRKFSDRYFRGFWSVILEKEYAYKYDDPIGERLRLFNEHIVDYLKQTSADEESYGCLWDLVSENDKKRFDNIITQTPERSLKENWEGIKWKLIVYQKHSFYNGGGHKK